MKIGILGAMREEIEPILKLANADKFVQYGKNIYYFGKIADNDVVIAYSKIGKVFSSLTASVMIEKFGIEKLLFSGVAGGLNPNLKIGDLIRASSLCQHDLDISTFGHPFGYVPEGSRFIYSDENLNKIADEVAKDLNVNLFTGIIATGDQFIADKNRKDWIKKHFDADAIEMEGGSVAVVCESLGIPFFVLRAISDSADEVAGFDFDSFLISSAKQSADFIVSMIERIK